jgi:aldehyde:ferredoxin oxidoreductase
MRIARINIDNDSIEYESITKDSKLFLLGARGLSSHIVHEEVPSGCDPLGSDNKLIIANGLFAGTPFPNSGRTSVGAKSPMTKGVKEANVGGRPGMMLSTHGMRALIFSGVSSTLKLILLSEEGIKIKSAEEYKGLGNYNLHSKLKAKYGEKIGIYSIGPAGEQKLLAATVCANDLEGYPSRHAARGGLGAVMGSKGIKAIVIIPSKGSIVKVNNLTKFREVSKPFTQMLAAKEAFSTYGTSMLIKPMSGYGGIPTKNFRAGSFDKIDKLSGERLHELVVARGGKKRLGCCVSCAIKCSNLYVDENGNHITSSLEYETIALNGTNCLIDDIDKIAWIDHHCDDAGIDTIEYGVTIGVAMDAGKIPWGDADKAIEILLEIKKGSELGKLYGNGVCHFGNEIGFHRIPHIKGQGISGYEPRVFKGMSVTYATSPMGADHTAGAAIANRKANLEEEYGTLRDNDRKLKLSYELQVYTAVLDSMGCCYFIGPYYQTMETVAGALNAMYDLNLTRENIIEIGKNILRSEVNFNEKAGITSEMNDLPKFFREEPSDPLALKVTIPKDDFKNFWKQLEM